MGDTGLELDPGHPLMRDSRCLLLLGAIGFSEIRSVTCHLACQGMDASNRNGGFHVEPT
jgi:hypothetical protein